MYPNFFVHQCKWTLNAAYVISNEDCSVAKFINMCQFYSFLSNLMCYNHDKIYLGFWYSCAFYVNLKSRMLHLRWYINICMIQIIWSPLPSKCCIWLNSNLVGILCGTILRKVHIFVSVGLIVYYYYYYYFTGVHKFTLQCKLFVVN